MLHALVARRRLDVRERELALPHRALERINGGAGAVALQLRVQNHLLGALEQVLVDGGSPQPPRGIGDAHLEIDAPVQRLVACARRDRLERLTDICRRPRAPLARVACARELAVPTTRKGR